MSETDRADALDRYVRFYETLTPDGVARLDEFVAPAVHFRDPFNDVRGVERLRAVLAHMFAITEASRFQVTDRAFGAAAAYVRWRYTFRPRGGLPWEITGVSELTFDGQGRVTEHLDHWDAAGQLYERVPVLGALLRLARRRLAVS